MRLSVIRAESKGAAGPDQVIFLPLDGRSFERLKLCCAAQPETAGCGSLAVGK